MPCDANQGEAHEIVASPAILGPNPANIRLMCLQRIMKVWLGSSEQRGLDAGPLD